MKYLISRFQQRRGPRWALPDPLRQAELALTSDTRQVWMGDTELAPFGLRAWSPATTVEEIDLALTDQIVAIVWPGNMSESLYRDLNRHITQSLPFDSRANPLVGQYNTDNQLLWDGVRYMFFGLRVAELAQAAELFDPDWEDDPAAAMRTIIDGFPVHDYPQETIRVDMAVNEMQLNVDGDPDWIEVENGNRILNFNNFDVNATRAAQQLSRLVNLVRSPERRPLPLARVLQNIELGVVDPFFDPQERPDADVLLGTFLEDNLALDTPAFTDTNISFEATESDVIFLDYSIWGGSYRGIGTLQILAVNNSTVIAMDNRSGNNVIPPNPLNPAPLSQGELGLNARVDNGVITITYRNTTPRQVLLKAVARRWRHGNGDFA